MRMVCYLFVFAVTAMHHDGITGTSRSSVVTDYMTRLTTGASAARAVLADMAILLLSRNVRSLLLCAIRIIKMTVLLMTAMPLL